MDRTQAISKFWNSFVMAYEENTVPEKNKLTYPYIAFDIVEDEFDYPVAMGATINDESSSWRRAAEVLDTISNAIGEGGIVIPYDNGRIWIRKAHPFAQRIAGEDAQSRKIVLNVTAEYI